ncbi:TPA: hypothetical protein ACGOV2_001919, partial [Streptococcus suis]
ELKQAPDVLLYRHKIPSMPLPFKLAFSSLRVIIEIEKGSCVNNYQRRTVKKTVARSLDLIRPTRAKVGTGYFLSFSLKIL